MSVQLFTYDGWTTSGLAMYVCKPHPDVRGGWRRKTESFGSDFVLTKVSPVIFSVVSVDTGDPDSCYFTFLEWA